jgi:hypothetical protein
MPEHSIARRAEQPPDHTSLVAVIYIEESVSQCFKFADGAPPILPREHFVILMECKSIFANKMPLALCIAIGPIPSLFQIGMGRPVFLR